MDEKKERKKEKGNETRERGEKRGYEKRRIECWKGEAETRGISISFVGCKAPRRIEFENFRFPVWLTEFFQVV